MEPLADRRAGRRAILLALFLLSVEAAWAAGGEDFRIEGRAESMLTGQPVSNGRIEIRLRRPELLVGGVYRLGRLAECPAVWRGRTDEAGRFEAAVGLGEGAVWLAVGIEADGWLGQERTLIPAVAGGAESIEFGLIHAELLAGEAEGVRQAHREQGGDEADDPPAAQAFEPADLDMRRAEAAGAPAFAVPEEVYVSSLAGTGYTGFMDLDELIAGTVTAEMNDGFPFEALKAQAVAARSFALDRLRRRGYANGGQAYTSQVGAKSRNATANTSRRVALHEGQVITAYFSARCNGDYTLNSEEGPTLSNCRVGGLGAGYVPWARSRPCSGHVNCSSTTEKCCTIVAGGRMQHIYGHGVGMCQRGAQQFAGRDGWGWRRILTHYYTGIEIANVPEVGADSPVAASAAVNVRSAPCGGVVLTSIPAGQRGFIVGGPERPACGLASPYERMTWWEVWWAGNVRGWVAEDYLQATGESAPASLDLEAAPTAGGVRLTWPIQFPSAIVEAAESLSPTASWVALANRPGYQMDRWRMELPTDQRQTFYRIRRPVLDGDVP